MQDMDDKLWQYGKLDNAGKKAFIGSDIMDSKGRLYTPDEYLANKVNPVLKEMAYDNRWSTIDYGQGFAAYAKAKEQQRLQAQLDSDNPTTLSKAIEIDMSERAGAAGANLNSAMVQLRTLFPNATKGSAYSKAIADGDYTQAAKVLENSITSKDPLVRQKARNYINLLKTEGQIYNNLTSGFTKEEREALAYVNGIEQTYPNTYEVGVKWRNAITDWVFGMQAILKGHVTLCEYCSSFRGKIIKAIWDWKDIKPGLIFPFMTLYIAKKRR
jgi:hypothetical protein